MLFPQKPSSVKGTHTVLIIEDNMEMMNPQTLQVVLFYQVLLWVARFTLLLQEEAQIYKQSF